MVLRGGRVPDIHLGSGGWSQHGFKARGVISPDLHFLVNISLANLRTGRPQDWRHLARCGGREAERNIRVPDSGATIGQGQAHPCRLVRSRLWGIYL